MMHPLLNSKLLSLLAPVAGLAACVIVGAGIYEASTHYVGSGFYSPKNHFISELGLASSTTMSHFFNRSLNVAGLLLMIFVIGLGRSLGNGLVARAGIITGIIATVSFSAVGYFTAADWIPHIITAFIFFSGAMLSVSLFVIVIWRDEQKRLHRILILHGILIAACYLAALFCPKDLFWLMKNDPAHFIRPAVWSITVLEWGYCLLICSWICMVSFNLLYNLSLDARPFISLTGKQWHHAYDERVQNTMTWIKRNLR